MGESEPARTLMVQGATSSAGKSFLVAGLCRLLVRRGLRVAPFKSQNMALNAAVCPDGGEIGRSQAMQAQAAMVPAEVEMNPILLKPEGDRTSQVVVLGRSRGSVSAMDYRGMREELWPLVTAALDDLRSRFDAVVLEGAGSPAEMNLRQGEIVNMRVAAAAQAPVLLAADIERGGVFAALLGTLDLLPAEERTRVHGLIVNRFRGDPRLFDGGVRFLEERSGVPVLGVVPMIDVQLPAEDSLELERLAGGDGGVLDLAIVAFPRISNFDELNLLRLEPGVSVRVVHGPSDLGRPDLVLLPGSKTTARDLAELRRTGLADAVVRASRAGSAVLGICGGYQMLGRALEDPAEVEGPATSPGLGLLPVTTVFEALKVTARRTAIVPAQAGLLGHAAGLLAPGYEIHVGRATGGARPAIEIDGAGEGCVSDDGWVVGTSVHGLLEDARLRRAVLEALAARKGAALPPPAPLAPDPFEIVADTLEQCLDPALLDRILMPSS
jgi:adenosylcobyric acid synthase